MPNTKPPPADVRLRRRALSKWDNEGGAIALPPEPIADVPDLTNAELVQLRIRVIALENLMIAVLAVDRRAKRALTHFWCNRVVTGEFP